MSKHILHDIKELKEHGGNMVQIMIAVHGYKLSTEEREPLFQQIKKYLTENDMKIVIHSSYTHNIARDWDNHTWWIKEIELEIKYAYVLGAIGVVIHLGKSLELPKPQAYNNMYTSLIHIHNLTKQYPTVKIFLETSSGQGSEMCYKLEDLAHFYKKFSNNPNPEIKNRVKLCIDTCHIFAAGYDITNSEKCKQYLNEFDELIGLKHVNLIHLNDSYATLGEKLDRHQTIGKGKIGYLGLKYMFDYFGKLDVPLVLETPGCGYDEIKLMKSEPLTS